MQTSFTPSFTLKQYALLTSHEMRSCEKFSIRNSQSSYLLMQKAGAAVVDQIIKHKKKKGSALVLVGPGNNGGDGWVIAQHLQLKGWNVVCASITPPSKLKGSALYAYKGFIGSVTSLPKNLNNFDVIVDALFGLGLSKPLTGSAYNWIKKVNKFKSFKVAVDIPSGICSDTGQILGIAFKADLTVTFFRKKRGHVLGKGLEFSGEVVVASIGMTNKNMNTIDVRVFENCPVLWQSKIPRPVSSSYKHKRGHTLVFGGHAGMSGAARLSGYAALRMGSGLVTILVPELDLAIYAQKQMALMSKGYKTYQEAVNLISTKDFTAFIVGPGNGVGQETCQRTVVALKTRQPIVLDADALTSFKHSPKTLFKYLHENSVLTPHLGEFMRLFPDLDPLKDKVTATMKAAKRTKSVVLLKGADTVIASPKGFSFVNSHSSPYLATAGSGDVLSGMIAGLMAQGMKSFDAACSSVWLHGEAALRFGPGLIAEDLLDEVPNVLKKMVLNAKSVL